MKHIFDYNPPSLYGSLLARIYPNHENETRSIQPAMLATAKASLSQKHPFGWDLQ
jgi:hypothetical protein